MLDRRVAELAKGLFTKYYSRTEIALPRDVERREFGFGDFEKKISFRHMAFGGAKELRKYLAAEAPPFASYSTAEYMRPEGRPMESKGWLGSELVFDLDATDLKLGCQAVHERGWVCSNCLESVRGETLKLIEDFLVPDFGLSASDISINFSGNRGYHVHVLGDDVMALDSTARRQITEYIAGINIDANRFFPTLGEARKVLYGPRPTDPGWGGKFARGIIAALNGGETAMVALGIEPAMARKLVASRADIVFGISVGNWDKVRIPKKADFWRRVISKMAIGQADSIDKNVTNDVHHLIRLPDTIHGDTGLVGRRIGSVAELGKFDPMTSAIAFRSGVMKVRTSAVPSLTMVGEQIGPFMEGDTPELPLYAALYLMLKRLAVPA